MSVRRLVPDARGTATIEFAMLSVFFFVVMLPALDYVGFYQQKLRLGAAVQQAAMVAYNARGTKKVSTTDMSAYLTAAMGSTTTTTVRCNGTTQCAPITPTMSCIGAPDASGWPVFTSPSGTSNGVSVCASGATPGWYAVIRASRPFQQMMVPDQWLRGSTITQQAVVQIL